MIPSQVLKFNPHHDGKGRFARIADKVKQVASNALDRFESATDDEHDLDKEVKERDRRAVEEHPEMYKSELKLRDTDLIVQKFNPNHDDKGEFSSGESDNDKGIDKSYDDWSGITGKKKKRPPVKDKHSDSIESSVDDFLNIKRPR